MPGLVLYRKYRPKTFAQVVGQEHIVRTVTNAIKEEIISHGYLFAGPHGCGKTTLARLFAKSVNCLERKKGQFEPCNQCWSCLEMNQGKAIDLIEIDAASNRGIDEVRDLKEGIRFKPAKSKYKVFIVDESHQLTREAANALLKTLEEPPEHAIFILATTEVHKMMPTILSRCQVFHFRKLKLDEIVSRLKIILKSEKMDFEKEAVDLIASAASGSIRDAESLLDQAISFSGRGEGLKEETVRLLLGSADKAVIFKFLQMLNEKKTKEAIELVNKIIFEGVDLKEFVKSVIKHLREALLFKINSQIESPLILSLTKEEKALFGQIAESWQEKKLQGAIETLMTAENKMKFASIVQLPLELAVVDICLQNQ